MKKIKYFAFLSFLAFFSSCNSDVFDEHEIGENLIDKSTEVLLIDTFTVESATVKLDSIVTSGGSSAVVGQYNDNFFGKIRSEYYGLVDLTNGGFKLKRNVDKTIIPVKYDSLVFISYFDQNFYGDTLKEQKISLHRVTEDIEKVEDNNFLYDHNTFNYEQTPLGELTFIPRPKRKKNGELYNLRIPMDDQLGEKFISMAMESNDTITGVADKGWKEFFKGIVLKSGVDDDAALLSFKIGDTLMKMRLYYSNLEGENSDKVLFYDFPVKSSELNFKNYTSDYSSTPQNLGRIKKLNEALGSEETDNLTFVQGGLGFMTKIKIPYVERLNTLGMTGGILKAELIIHPKEGSHDRDIYTLPDTPFNLYRTNADNMVLDPIINPTTKQAVTSIPFINRDNYNESYYAIDVTGYVNNILLTGQKYDDALLLSFPLNKFGDKMDEVSIQSWWGRMVIENDPKSDFRIRLKTTYVVQK